MSVWLYALLFKNNFSIITPKEVYLVIQTQTNLGIFQGNYQCRAQNQLCLKSRATMTD